MWHGQQLPITFHLVSTLAKTSYPRYVGTPISAVSLLAGPDLRITPIGGHRAKTAWVSRDGCRATRVPQNLKRAAEKVTCRATGTGLPDRMGVGLTVPRHSTGCRLYRRPHGDGPASLQRPVATGIIVLLRTRHTTTTETTHDKQAPQVGSRRAVGGGGEGGGLGGGGDGGGDGGGAVGGGDGVGGIGGAGLGGGEGGGEGSGGEGGGGLDGGDGGGAVGGGDGQEPGCVGQ